MLEKKPYHTQTVITKSTISAHLRFHFSRDLILNISTKQVLPCVKLPRVKMIQRTKRSKDNQLNVSDKSCGVAVSPTSEGLSKGGSINGCQLLQGIQRFLDNKLAFHFFLSSPLILKKSEETVLLRYPYHPRKKPQRRMHCSLTQKDYIISLI